MVPRLRFRHGPYLLRQLLSWWGCTWASVRLEQVSAPLTMQRDSHIWFRRWLLPQSWKSCRARGRTVKAYDLNVCGVQHSPFSLWNDELRGLPLGIEMEVLLNGAFRFY